MDNSTFTSLVSWVIAHGYILFFIACFIEGPLVTAAAGVAAALGYYNIAFIVGISVLGDLSADAAYYTIGYFGGSSLIKQYGNFVGLTEHRVSKIKNLLHMHLGKTLLLVKVSPLIPLPGLILIGSLRAPFKRFIQASFIITLPKSLFFALLGFFFGEAYTKLSTVIKSSQYILFGIVILIFLIYFLYQKFTSYMSNDIA